MIRHTILISIRNFNRYRASFLINLTGLSTGLACVFMIYLWVHDELAIDRFHENGAHLFRVMQNLPVAEDTLTIEVTPAPLASVLIEQMPEVKAVTVVANPISNGTDGVITAGDLQFKATEQFASTNFFETFSFSLIHGKKEQVLTDKYAVVVSEDLAIRLFGTTQQAIGKTISWQPGITFPGEGQVENTFIVSGVFENLPSISSTQFDLLFTYDLFLARYETRFGLKNWTTSRQSHFVRLQSGTDVQRFNTKINQLLQAQYAATETPTNPERLGTLFVQSYGDQYLYNEFKNGVQAGGRIQQVRWFSIIAILILLIACINFINLSTARASRRLREIGIKKVLGARQITLFYQYIGEALIITLIAAIVALILVQVSLPTFNSITGKQLSLHIGIEVISSLSGIILLTGLLAGSYPAVYLSRFKPAVILKGKLPYSFGELWTRQGLVVFQFTISILLISSVLVVAQQIRFIHTKSRGYNDDHIISIKREGMSQAKLATFLNEVKQFPGVIRSSSFQNTLTGDHGMVAGDQMDWEGKVPGNTINFANLNADYGLLELLDLKLADGRSFSRENGNEQSKIIFNESAIRMMGLDKPVGKVVQLWGASYQIIGVLKDFHLESFYEAIEPCFFVLYPNGDHILLKLQAEQTHKTLAKIETLYETHTGGLPFSYRFLEDEYRALYASEERIAIISQYFAAIAIVISCLGLLGLAVFNAERRQREIGIRKILGASVSQLVQLLSIDFTKMVLVAVVIAVPISYLIAHRWLENFAYKIELEWWFFAGAAFATLLIAWFTVGFQTLKAANTNPIESLRDE